MRFLLCLAVLVGAWPGGALAFDLLAYEAQRDTWQQVERLFTAAQITARSSVADIGAGHGYLTVRLASRVQRVYAIEIDDTVRARLTERVASWPSVTVHAQVGRAPLDAAVLLNVWDVMVNREATVRAALVALRPGGRLVVAERDARWSTAQIVATLLTWGCATAWVESFHSEGDGGLILCEQ